ncbi:SAVMC3_10250 family protein [Actinophytocola glycyrrhizae]|uniref:SAVMC3_10250 family protein n=1 Tax=Actinophytocola glycyrrhizae TaxID=2044873 RepID=A0ABV9SFH4_9PSEU
MHERSGLSVNRKAPPLNIGRRRGFLGTVKATVNLLNIGSFSGEIGTQRNIGLELNRAVENLETVWFTEQVRAYEWVEFEALMSYTTIGSAVVFLDVAGSTGGCPSGGESRLLLHGSSGNLVDEGPHSSVTAEELSELAAARSVYHPDVLASVVNHFVDLIEYRSDESSDQTDTGPGIHGSWFNNHIGGAGLHHVVPALADRLRLPYTAGWVRGHARVTGVAPATAEHPYTLFASPLYVQLGRPE